MITLIGIQHWRVVEPCVEVPWSFVPLYRFWGYSCCNGVAFYGRRWPEVLKVPRRSHKVRVAQVVVCAPKTFLWQWQREVYFWGKPRTKASFSHLLIPYMKEVWSPPARFAWQVQHLEPLWLVLRGRRSTWSTFIEARGSPTIDYIGRRFGLRGRRSTWTLGAPLARNLGSNGCPW